MILGDGDVDGLHVKKRHSGWWRGTLRFERNSKWGTFI
jgi:hypothetical protein